jgi:NAD(P)-dependent dehydrogenase (short-subunit alcohol dehydrogenase family)
VADEVRPKRWLITGVSSGLGRALADAALTRGDAVAGTLRDPAQVAAFEAMVPGRSHGLRFDVTDSLAVRQAVDQAAAKLGGLDVVVNNAGYCLAGSIEAVSETEARAQFDANFFGALVVIQAALPHLRAGGGGRIINIASLAALSGVRGMALYSASKFALAGLSEALAQEVEPFGVRVTVVEPSGFRTQFGSSLKHAARRMPEYEAVRAAMEAALAKSNGAQINDPVRGAAALLALADHPDPPVHFALGADAPEKITGVLNRRLTEYARTDPDGTATGFDAPAPC